MPIESFIAMGNAINSSINDIYSFVALAVAPFNIIKSVIDGVITVILYKYLSRHLKGNV
jgi:riboflavin transporter FmnP